MDRVVVVGGSGSGKSALAQRLGNRLDMPTIELDALFHNADWEPTPTNEFRRRVAEALDTDRWVVAGNYTVSMDLVHGAADTIVWLDMARWLVTWRVLRRSVQRVLQREELWNGNREHIRNLISRDPEVNIIVWAWKHHAVHTARYQVFMNGVFWSHAAVFRLRSRGDVRRFMKTIDD